jgi:tetratricopeptide (TPR) repeat protein
MSDDDRALLDVAACVGAEFDPGLVADVAGLDRISALRCFARIERVHRLVRANGRSLLFDHHHVLEALQRGLIAQLSEEYQAAIARLLERRLEDSVEPEGALSARICEHYLRGMRGKEARRHLAATRGYLRSSCQHAEMVEVVERALRVDDGLQGEDRARTLMALAAALDALGRRERQEETAREAQAIAENLGNAYLASSAANAVANLYLATARYEDAEHAFRQRLELATEAGDRYGELAGMGGIGLTLERRGRIDEANAQFKQCVELARDLGDAKLLAHALAWDANTYSVRGDREGARRGYEEALALYRSIDHIQGESMMAGNLAIVASSQGDPDRARELLARNIELCRKIGYRLGEAIAHYNLANALANAHEPDGAVDAVRTCLRIAGEIGHRHLAAAAQRDLGMLLTATGRTDEARAELREAAHCGFPTVEVLALCDLAAHLGGDPDAALASFAAIADRLSAFDRREAHLLLWLATREATHLQEAKQRVDDALAAAPEQHRDAMRQNVRVNRDILAAWEAEHGGGEPGGTESVTRVG